MMLEPIWVVRKGFSDKAYHQLLEALERLEIKHYVVEYVPFDDENVYGLPENFDEKDVIVYGGQGLINYGKKHGWTGVYQNDNFSVDAWMRHYGTELLNYDSAITTIEKAFVDAPRVFVRPVHDTKSFSGQLMDREDFYTWKNSILAIPDDVFTTINGKTEISISTVKDIVAEYRLFVVDGKVVTGSEYKRGDTVAYHSHIPEYVLEYANLVIAMWEPDKAYCLDIAELYGEGAGCKVLEINCINGCGLYAADVYKYVHTLHYYLSDIMVSRHYDKDRIST